MVRIAFIINAHTDPEHLRRMTDALPASAEFYVHVDAKSDIRAFESVTDNPRVHFTKKRINVMWGSLGVVDSQMMAVEEALESGKEYDYFISASGLDYPLYSNDRIEAFLDSHKGTNFIYGVDMEDQGSQSKLYRQYRFLNNKSWRYKTLKSKFRVSLREITYALGIRKPLHFEANGKNYKLYKGAMWWAITPELMKAAYQCWRDDRDFLRYFKTSFAPDETFIPTIAFNDEAFRKTAIGEPETFTRLEDVTPLTFIDYTHGIKILDESDLPRLLSSGKMFCRKTITGQSDKLMDKIDKIRNAGDGSKEY